MPSDPTRLISLLFTFMLVSVRVAGTFYFIPIPGSGQMSKQAKLLMVAAITFSLYSTWPVADASQPTLSRIVLGLGAEAALGLCVGLVVMLAAECVAFFFHAVGMQAGYTFASTVDPTSKADVTVLESIGSLAAGFLFFTLGLHLEVIRALGASLTAYPPGTWTPTPGLIEPVLRLVQEMFSTGLRLAMPITAALLMIDVSLALIGRVNGQLQLLHLVLPAKMLASLALLSWLLVLLPSTYGDLASHILAEIHRMIGV